LRTALRGFDFVSSERYAEFRQGDKVAEYGLGGLIIGGAAALAAKGGFFKSFGKMIGWAAMAAFAAAAAFLRNIFKRR
jgi:uncharacterized membrane-anchored protein